MTAIGLLILLAGFALGILIPWLAYKRFLRVWRHPRVIFGTIFFIGLAFGGVFSTWTRLTSPTMKVIGFPLPLAAFQLEEGHWTDFVLPQPTAIGFLILNYLSFISSLFLFSFILSFMIRPSQNAAEQDAAANP